VFVLLDLRRAATIIIPVPMIAVMPKLETVRMPTTLLLAMMETLVLWTMFVPMDLVSLELLRIVTMITVVPTILAIPPLAIAITPTIIIPVPMVTLVPWVIIAMPVPVRRESL